MESVVSATEIEDVRIVVSTRSRTCTSGFKVHKGGAQAEMEVTAERGWNLNQKLINLPASLASLPIRPARQLHPISSGPNPDARQRLHPRSRLTVTPAKECFCVCKRQPSPPCDATSATRQSLSELPVHQDQMRAGSLRRRAALRTMHTTEQGMHACSTKAPEGPCG